MGGGATYQTRPIPIWTAGAGNRVEEGWEGTAAPSQPGYLRPRTPTKPLSLLRPVRSVRRRHDAWGAVWLWVALALAGCAADPAPATRPLAEAEYVGDAACAGCHADIAASYAQTNHARAVEPFDPATAPEAFDAAGRSPAVYDPNLDLFYRAFVRGDTLFQREFRLDARGDTTHRRVHAAAYVIGSGHNTRSYLMQEGGYLTEMPLTWYVERGMWALSPGFEQVNTRFERPMTLECIACHNAIPEHTPGTQNHFGALPDGISCERCHGPASEHVEDPQDQDALVDLGGLNRDLQLAACQQCHLEGVTIFAPGEGPTTYRPGEPLAAHRTVFVPAEQIADPDNFGVASHAVRLALSVCFEESQMTCTTCHDPHLPAEVQPSFNATCQSCHGGDGGGSAHEALCTRPAAGSPAEAMTGDCVSCHMQTGATSDIPHVSFTDHWIRRRLPEDRQPAPIEVVLTRPEPLELVDVLAHQGMTEGRPPAEAALEEAVALFHFFETKHPNPGYLPRVIGAARRGLAGGADRADARIALARALTLSDSLAAAERVLEEASEAFPDEPLAHYWLGATRLRTGDAAGAAGPLERAAALQPRLIEAQTKWAEALSASGRAADAERVLEAAVRLNPVHHPEAWNNLGFLRLQAGRFDAAAEALERAVRLDPDFVEARTNLGSAYLLAERLGEAAEQFEAAVRADPDYAPAHGNLGVIYLRQGRPADARRQFERVLALTPGDPQARAYLEELR